MEKEQVEEWLKDTVSDLFMDFCFYDRKEDEEVNQNQLREFMDDGTITKKEMIKVFMDQIDNEYPKK